MKRLILIGAIMIACTVHAEAPQRWTLNLKDADLRELVAAVGDITGKTLLLDAKVAGSVTVMSPSPLDVEGIYALFLSALKSNGYTAVEQGQQVVIVPIGQAKTTFNDARQGGGDRFTTAVLPLNATAAGDVATVLRPLVSENGYLAPSTTANALIVSDSAGNIERMREVLRELDTNKGFSVIALKHAQARETAKILVTGLSAGGQSSPLKIIGNARTNSLIVVGDTRLREQVASMVQLLDVTGTANNAQVVRLQHSTAKKLAELLGGLDRGQAAGGGQGIAAAPSAVASSGTSASKMLVQADESQNALVLIGDPGQLALYRTIIAELDRPRAQVLVEAAIVEVTGDISEALGVQWAFQSSGINAGSSFKQAGATVGGVLGGKGGDLPNGLVLGLGSARFGALITALSGNSNANLLSTPSLLTLDNEPAEIMVGQNVPFVSGSYDPGKEGATNPYTTIERKDVGISLKVTPRINEGDTFRLEIEHESSEVTAPPSDVETRDVVTNKRTLKTTIMAADGQIIVLGGLIKDSVTHTESKVPLLGDIPLLGALFKHKSEVRKKTNLMVFLRPMLIRDGRAAADISSRKYDAAHRIDLPADGSPVLPSDPQQIFNAAPQSEVAPTPAAAPATVPEAEAAAAADVKTQDFFEMRYARDS